VKKENKLALQHSQMRMTRWVCDIKVTDRFTCDELRERERWGTDNIITAVQQNSWY